jgi:hypothetical protein
VSAVCKSWDQVLDLLGTIDGHLKLEIESESCWAGELRVGLTNPPNAPARSIVFFSAGGADPEEVVTRLLADFHDWQRNSGVAPLSMQITGEAA